MDIELIQNFKNTLNQQLDELLISQIEQYRDELEKLNQNLEQTACMIKEKESLIQELQKQVDENKFEQSNFTNVSIIQNLNNQIKALSSKNALLETSLRLRQNADKERFQESREDNSVNEGEEPPVDEVEENNVLPEEENSLEVEPTVLDQTHNNEIEEENNEVEAVNDTGEDVEEVEEEEAGEEDDEEEVQVVEIEHNRKTYYIQNNEVFQKKKDGSMGKKVGVMDGESVVLDEKPKKDKKDKKAKKEGNKKKKKKTVE